MTGQYTLVKLAQLLEVHPNTLQKWLKREDVKHAIIEAQGEIHSQVQVQLKALTLKATQKLHELVDSPIDAVSLQAVKDVLDRGGHKAKQEIKVEKTVTTIEQQFKQLIDQTIVDADFEVMDEDS
jgi:transposase-like protein